MQNKIYYFRRKSTKKHRLDVTFPWWCLFFAYALSFLIIGLSIFFILVRGIEFGDAKTQKWLASVLTGFFSSILLSQPLKIVVVAIILTLFCRKSNNEQVREESVYIDDVTVEIDRKASIQADEFSVFDRRESKHINRLDKIDLAYARQERLKTIEMWSIIKEFVLYLIFLVLIYLITFSNRHQSHFYQVQHLRNYLLGSKYHEVRQISLFNDEK